jgi:hypothetical protein
LKKLRVGVIDLATKAPTRSLYARVMHANLASIMPQVVATWCEQEGHEVTFTCYTGLESILDEIPGDVDIVFVSAFTQSALLAYALSNMFHSRGAVTVLGGPHARCYPEDARRYYDYVLGFTDREVIRGVLAERAHSPGNGAVLAAQKQPAALPGVRERWKYVEATMRKAPVLKIVPMLGSLGCPYSCSFCIDADVPYQPLSVGTLQEDLRFLRQKMRTPRIGWHDPNFGVRFQEIMAAIEEVAPPGSIESIAESSLSLLSEPHLKRLQANGFKAILPGVESWYSLGNKSKTGSTTGLDKVRAVSDHVNLILKYIPYVQTNFVLGLDVDRGAEPFELTKRFLDLTPGAFPGYSLLSAFGQASPLNLDLQREGRVIPFPFHFLDNNQAMNVRPLNYTWTEFYDHLIDLVQYSFSVPAIARRFRANRGVINQGMNVVRAVSSEGWGRLGYHREIRRRLDRDPELRAFFHQETTEIPRFYADRIRMDLGPLYDWLPEGATEHDAYAYHRSRTPVATTAAFAT